MNDKLFGEIGSDVVARENQQCREIVREISMFGVSQRQMMYIMYLMSMELENNEHMLTFTSTIKQLSGQNLFLKKDEDEDGTTF